MPEPEPESIVEELKRNPSVEDAIVVSRDGWVITPDNAKPEQQFLAAETVDLFTSTHSGMSDKFARGGLDCLSLEGQNGSLILKSISPDFYLLVAARSDMNLGMMRLDVRKASEALGKALL